MTETPNPKDFSVDEREGEFVAVFTVTGEIRVTITAEDLEEARGKAYAMCAEEDFGLELDEADDIDVSHVRKTPKMFRVTRDGRPMKVSLLAAGDLPRDPHADGF